MQPIDERTVRRLRLEEAAVAELSAFGNLLPPVPGLDSLAGHIAEIGRTLVAELRQGMYVPPQYVVSARKAGHGSRPVPIVGVEARIVFRALVDFILRNEPPLDRTPQAYLSFANAPILYSRDLVGPEGQHFLKIFGSEIKYVVQTDVTAYYQYVDHEILGDELLARTGDFEAIQALKELLADLHGRRFGLPQLLDPSDRLSEIYIDIVERDLLRREFPCWRFNDDFRIACRDYPEALKAIEAIDDATRAVGLVISEYKTYAKKFPTYAFEVMGLQLDDTFPAGDPQDVEGLVADYSEVDDSEGAEDSARSILATELDNEEDDVISLRKASSSDIRILRRALRAVTRAQNVEALPKVIDLLVYVPALTPLIAEYLLSVAALNPDGVASIVDTVIERVSLSHWQAQWFIRVIRQLHLVSSMSPEHPRHQWVRRYWAAHERPNVRAEAALTLAAANAIAAEELEHGLRFEPSAFNPWYLEGLKSLRQHGSVSDQHWQSLVLTPGIFRWILSAAEATT